MSEYIGSVANTLSFLPLTSRSSRISLISNSDIRYVGTLVEINSENATVALENVMSYGTEDRRTGEDAYGPSTSLYDYILFRGSDVKDLRIEEAPKESSPAPPPQMPNDPAILGVSPSPNFKSTGDEICRM
jgi:protein LSM14